MQAARGVRLRNHPTQIDGDFDAMAFVRAIAES